MKIYKIKFKKSPDAQCIVGKFNGWYQVWEAYLFKNKFVYSQPFTYQNLSQYNKLLKHIQNNRIRGQCMEQALIYQKEGK